MGFPIKKLGLVESVRIFAVELSIEEFGES